jgi:hypothetical protein
MFYQIIFLFILILIVLYLSDAFVSLEQFGSKILNLNINNSQSGSNEPNIITPYYGSWYNYRPYYPRYPYYYNNYYGNYLGNYY